MILFYLGVEKDEEGYANNKEPKTGEEERLSGTEEVNDGILVGEQGIPPIEEEVTDLVLGKGIPPLEDFPFLNRCKIPIESDDNVCNGLVNDMSKFCSDQSQSIEFRSRANNQNHLMLTIPTNDAT
jgi:hypothetical protein